MLIYFDPNVIIRLTTVYSTRTRSDSYDYIISFAVFKSSPVNSRITHL